MKRFPNMAGRTIAAGMLFGVVVFSVMTFIVVPLDAAPKATMAVADYVNGLVATTLFLESRLRL